MFFVITPEFMQISFNKSENNTEMSGDPILMNALNGFDAHILEPYVCLRPNCRNGRKDGNMKKKALEDDIFNAVLEQAFAEAVAEEFADVPAAEVQSQVLPKKKRTKRKWIIYTGLLIAAAGAVLLFLLMNAGSDGYSIETPEYVFGYIPEEYELSEYGDLDYVRYEFQHAADDSYINISYYPAKDTSISFDNEYSIITEHSINGYIAQLIKFPVTISNVITLFWSDGNNFFKVNGTVSEETLFKVAENIVRKPQ